MKNIIIRFAVLILLAVGTSLSGFAYMCKISPEGDSVEALSASISGSVVKVTLSNDSKDSAANVTVTVEVTYSFGGVTKTTEYSGKTMVKAGDEKDLSIPISSNWNGNSNYKPVSVRVTSISGAKCGN